MARSTSGAGRGAHGADQLGRSFEIFATTQCRGRSTVYEHLSRAAAHDADLLDLLAATPSDQRRPSLLFAGVNLLLASHPGAALADYYPIHGGRRRADDQLAPAFSSFCTDHRAELAGLLLTRSTQTNEIRRCIALRLGLAHVERCWPGALALVEVGASAGLNLLFDHFRYRVGDLTDGPAASPVVITCALRGRPANAPVLGEGPRITARVGIDRQPIDLHDAEARAWLEAFVWPEQVDELATLRRTVEVALHRGVPTVVAGDATRDVARLLDGLPGRGAVVVFTASLLTYLGPTARSTFVAQLDRAAGRRPVAWVFAEAPGLVARAEVDAPALRGRLGERNTCYVIGARLRGRAAPADRLLGLADPYLRWLAPARGDADDFGWLAPDVG